MAQSIAESVAITLRVTPTGNFPNLHGAIPAGRGEPAAVRAEGHPGNRLLVSRERDTTRRFVVVWQGGRVPDAHRVIVAGGGELGAVVIERCAADNVAVGEDPEHLS